MDLKFIPVVLVFTLLFSCVRSSVDTSLGDCEATVAYNSNTENDVFGVKSIIDTKCATSMCHDGTFPPNMLTFGDQFKSAISNNQIKEQVFDEGAMPEPEAPQLTDDELQLLECWITGGHLENG